jgi:ankyrin repeat protein
MKTTITSVMILLLACAPVIAQPESESQPSPDEQALLQSAYLGQLEEVRRLVPGILSPDTIDAEKRTPLMFASFNGHTPVIAYLLEAGAAVDSTDSAGRTALMYAASGPFPEAVAMLLVWGAEVNIQGTLEGFTPLMTAAAEGQAEVVEILLDAGADRDLKDQDGDTALSFARENGHSHVVALLE